MSSQPENRSDVSQALRTIGLALNASNGVIATDDPARQTDDKSWRIDHSAELDALRVLREALEKGQF